MVILCHFQRLRVAFRFEAVTLSLHAHVFHQQVADAVNEALLQDRIPQDLGSSLC